MPSLKIQFPEKQAPSLIALSGQRITVGRKPANTIQILDRTLSGIHAELVLEEDGHYRLHDLGSTNGTFVNGEQVMDYHLGDVCKVAFGTVECDFDPGANAEAGIASAEALPTLAEVSGLRRTNEDLRRQISTLEEELASLRLTQAPGGNASGLEAELKTMVLERGELKEAADVQAREIDRLKGELALVKRDRSNLQNALRQANGAEQRRAAGEAGSPIAVKTPEGDLKPVPPPPAPLAPMAPRAPISAPAQPLTATPRSSPVPSLKPISPSPAGIPAPSLKPLPSRQPVAVPRPAVASAGQAAPAGVPVARPGGQPGTAGVPVPRPAGQPAAPRVVAAASQPAVRAVPRPIGPSGTQRIPRPSEKAAS